MSDNLSNMAEIVEETEDKTVISEHPQGKEGPMREDIIGHMREHMAFQMEREVQRTKSEIKKTLKEIAIKRENLAKLQLTNDQVNYTVKKYLNIAKCFGQPKALQCLVAEIKRTAGKKWTYEGDIHNSEEVLNEYKKYKIIIFTMSCLDTQDEQVTELQEAVKDMGLEFSPDRVPPSTKEAMPSSTQSDTLTTDCNLNSDRMEYDDNLKQYLTDCQRLVDLSDGTRNLSLTQNSRNMDKVMEQTIETTNEIRKNLLNEKEKLMLKENEMKDRIEREKKRAVMLKDLIELHESLHSLDQDVMMQDLMKKMDEVYFYCVDRQIANLSTLEKLSTTERRMHLLLQRLESVPEELLKKLRFSKARERRSRLDQERLQKEAERRMEMRKIETGRAIEPPKRTTGRKLMPRHMLVKPKVKASEEATDAIDDFNMYLFDEDSD